MPDYVESPLFLSIPRILAPASRGWELEELGGSMREERAGEVKMLNGTRGDCQQLEMGESSHGNRPCSHTCTQTNTRSFSVYKSHTQCDGD